MTVEKLISVLRQFPGSAPIHIVYDSAARLELEAAVLRGTREKPVVLVGSMDDFERALPKWLTDYEIED
jgi:riboflavin biosynthesis pyrimidine reductase